MHLRAFPEATALPKGQLVFRGRAEFLSESFSRMLADTTHAKCRWHGLRRRGVAAAYHRKAIVAYFV